MKLRSATAIVLAALALFAAPAFAGPDTVELTNISGSWFNAVPPPPGVTIVNGNPLSTIRWGTPFPPNTFRSGYDYTAVPGPLDFIVNPPPSTAGQLAGTFNHVNFPITGTFLQTVQLDIEADVAVDAFPQGKFHFIFDFTHDETPNNANPCKYGGANGQGVNINGCADQVTVTGSTLTQTFTVAGVQYTLDVLGFSQDGGITTTNKFLTIENSNNTAGLYARVSAVTPTVPEPGSLALLGLGLLAAGFLRRRSNR